MRADRLAGRFITIGALAISFCAAGPRRSAEPAREIRPETHSPAAPSSWQADMIAVPASDHTFYMDRFETSELSPGDYFSARNQLPAVNLTREEAEKICKRVDKRLCTLDEWRSACLGVAARSFGYGNASVRGRCNVGGSALVRAGEKIDCRSDSDIHDLIGNAMEWVSDSVEGRAVAAGGSFATGEKTDCFTVHFLAPEARSSQTGVRC